MFFPAWPDQDFVTLAKIPAVRVRENFTFCGTVLKREVLEETNIQGVYISERTRHPVAER